MDVTDARTNWRAYTLRIFTVKSMRKFQCDKIPVYDGTGQEIFTFSSRVILDSGIPVPSCTFLRIGDPVPSFLQKLCFRPVLIWATEFPSRVPVQSPD